jgi:phosphoribosylamine--glycine ligase
MGDEMKVLLVGGGAREHAIALALKKNPNVELFSVLKNRNPGIIKLSKGVSNHDAMEVEKTVAFAKKSMVDLAFIGPESPLAVGMADALSDASIPCVGPKKTLARIESDKRFMRELMDKYKIPGRLNHKTFNEVEAACKYLDEVGGEVAVKPIGLTGGKGVKVAGEQLKSVDETKSYVKEVIEKGIGGGEVILEEKAVGEEFTLMAFVGGDSISLMPAIQDHKRAFEGDTGHNTGGMGSYSVGSNILPFMEKEDYNEAAFVMLKTVKALNKETGEKYKGVLYGQFMLGEKIKLIEFNCRFGDPEAMNVLSIMKSDLTDVSLKIIEGNLGKVEFDDKATVCKYIVPQGYGIKSTGGQKLNVDEQGIQNLGARLYYAAVDEKDGDIFTTSSRSIGIVGIADKLDEAEKVCEEAVQMVSGEQIYHRADIGTKSLIDKKLERMRSYR